MRNYWPLGIFLFILVVVGFIAFTIKIALQNPVELKAICQKKSQEIDANINTIVQAEQRFLKQYDIEFEGSYKQSTEEFRQAFLKILSKDKKPINHAKVHFYLTRPHTTKEDQDLGDGEFVDEIWQSPFFKVQNLGRYEIEASITIDDDSICIMQEYNIR